MRAKFIYEKFKEDSDPIKDMNVGIFMILDYITYPIWNFDNENTEKIKRKFNHKEILTILRNWYLASGDMAFISLNGDSYSCTDLSGKRILYKNKIYQIPDES